MGQISRRHPNRQTPLTSPKISIAIMQHLLDISPAHDPGFGRSARPQAFRGIEAPHHNIVTGGSADFRVLSGCTYTKPLVDDYRPSSLEY
jgi:hypothetical protein